MYENKYFKIPAKSSKNPWMDPAFQPDVELFLKQHRKLQQIYRSLGVEVFKIRPRKDLCDSWPANIAWGRNGIFVMGNFHPDLWWRQAETPHYARWLVDNRFGVVFLPPDVYFGGQASLITLNKHYIYGWGDRDSEDAIEHIEEQFRIHKLITSIQLADPDFYDNDTAMHFARGCEGLVWCPEAFNSSDIRRVERVLEKEKLASCELSKSEVIQDKGNNRRNFVLNSVYIGENEIMPWDEEFSEFPRKLAKFIDERGGRRHTLDFSEAGVSGAGPRCASLFLD
jgi:N-dimethylarginine dimethylaminohydrolase